MLDIVDFSEHINCGALEKNNDDSFSCTSFFVEGFIVTTFQSDQSLQLLFHEFARFCRGRDKTITWVAEQEFAQKDGNLVGILIT